MSKILTDQGFVEVGGELYHHGVLDDIRILMGLLQLLVKNDMKSVKMVGIVKKEKLV